MKNVATLKAKIVGIEPLNTIANIVIVIMDGIATMVVIVIMVAIMVVKGLTGTIETEESQSLLRTKIHTMKSEEISKE